MSHRGEHAGTKVMRENFERHEKQALRTSKVYIDVTKMKKIQKAECEVREMKGTGEEYVDSDRRIAVGLGNERLLPFVNK